MHEHDPRTSCNSGTEHVGSNGDISFSRFIFQLWLLSTALGPHGRVGPPAQSPVVQMGHEAGRGACERKLLMVGGHAVMLMLVKRLNAPVKPGSVLQVRHDTDVQYLANISGE